MKLTVKRLFSLIPTPLPVGMTQFEEWSESIIELSGNYADTDSLKFAMASMILHLGAQRSRVPKNHFVQSLRKVAANQVASQVFQDIKVKQQEAAAKQQAEATALTSEALTLNGETQTS